MVQSALSSLSIFAANDDQIEESWRRTYEAWGKTANLTLEQHQLRKRSLAALEASKDTKLITWVLAPRDNPTTVDYMCSCETYRREGYVWYQSSTDRSDKLSKSVTCYAIASVFTPKEKRGNGYAKHMMRLLHWVIADESLLPKPFPVEWGAPPSKVSNAGNGLFSALWSDIGDFYAQCGPLPAEEGWVLVSPKSTIWNVEAAAAAQEEGSNGDYYWLNRISLSTLWEKDTSSIKCSAPEFISKARTSFTFLPHNGVAAYQHERMEHLVQKLDVQEFGVVVGANQLVDVTLTKETAFASWVMEEEPDPDATETSPDDKTLLITRLESRVEDFGLLFKAIVSIAKQYGMKRIETYNLTPDLHAIATSLGGGHQARKIHLSAVKWYGQERVTSEAETSEVAWLYNERFCWC